MSLSNESLMSFFRACYRAAWILWRLSFEQWLTMYFDYTKRVCRLFSHNIYAVSLTWLSTLYQFLVCPSAYFDNADDIPDAAHDLLKEWEWVNRPVMPGSIEQDHEEDDKSALEQFENTRPRVYRLLSFASEADSDSESECDPDTERQQSITERTRPRQKQKQKQKQKCRDTEPNECIRLIDETIATYDHTNERKTQFKASTLSPITETPYLEPELKPRPLTTHDSTDSKGGDLPDDAELIEAIESLLGETEECAQTQGTVMPDVDCHDDPIDWKPVDYQQSPRYTREATVSPISPFSLAKEVFETVDNSIVPQEETEISGLCEIQEHCEPVETTSPEEHTDQVEVDTVLEEKSDPVEINPAPAQHCDWVDPGPEQHAGQIEIDTALEERFHQVEADATLKEHPDEIQIDTAPGKPDCVDLVPEEQTKLDTALEVHLQVKDDAVPEEQDTTMIESFNYNEFVNVPDIDLEVPEFANEQPAPEISYDTQTSYIPYPVLPPIPETVTEDIPHVPTVQERKILIPKPHGPKGVLWPKRLCQREIPERANLWAEELYHQLTGQTVSHLGYEPNIVHVVRETYCTRCAYCDHVCCVPGPDVVMTDAPDIDPDTVMVDIVDTPECLMSGTHQFDQVVTRWLASLPMGQYIDKARARARSRKHKSYVPPDVADDDDDDDIDRQEEMFAQNPLRHRRYQKHGQRPYRNDRKPWKSTPLEDKSQPDRLMSDASMYSISCIC